MKFLSIKILSKLLASFLSIFITANIFAQKIINPEVNSFQGRFFTYDLPTSGNMTVSYFYQDRLGFLWLGTYGALYRFDGTEYILAGTSTNDNLGFAGKIITGICEDTLGNLWIGTTGALNRYDIRSGLFSHFCPDSLNYMSADNEILYMRQDRTGVIWMITGGDIYSFDPARSRFKRFPINDRSKTGRFESYARNYGKILIDSQSRIWFATSYGLYLYREGSDNLKLFTQNLNDQYSISGDRISFVIEDVEGRIWVGTNGNGINQYFDSENGSFRKNVLPVSTPYKTRFDTIYSLLSDRDSTIWVFGMNAFGNFHPESGKFNYYIIPEGKNNNVQRDNSNLIFQNCWQRNNDEIWFLNSGKGMIFRFSKATENLTLFPAPMWSTFHLITDDVNSIILSGPYDSFMRLVLDNLPFSQIIVQNSDEADQSNKNIIAEDNSGKIWFTFSSGIYINEKFSRNSAFSLKKHNISENDTILNSLYRDRTGNLWFSMRNGNIYKYDPVNGKKKMFSLPKDYVGSMRNIKEDHQGNLWFSNYYSIFFLKHDGDKILRFYPENEEIRSVINSGIYDFLVDSNNNLWFAAFDNGAYALNLDSNKLYHYPAINNRFGDICFRISEDSLGRIWFIFNQNGLYLFDPDKKILINKDIVSDSKVLNSYFNLFIDKKGLVWTGDARGISVLNPETGYVRRIPIDNISSNLYFCQLKSDDIITVTGRRLYLFPDSVPFNNKIPKVFISSLKINQINYCWLYPKENEVRLLDKIRLERKQNNLKIEFTALNFINAASNQYKYFMNGADLDTVMTSSSVRFSEYKKLRPGSYTFWVTGSNNDGVWNPSGKKLEILIKNSWYVSPLAIVIYLLLFFTTIAGFIRLRLYQLNKDRKMLELIVKQRTSELEKKNQQIEELDKVKTRFFTEISHEIRTPLSLITGPIDNLIRENQTIDEERRIRWLEMIRRNSKRLLKLVNQLLDISRLDAGKMKISLIKDDILNFLRILVNEYLSLSERRKIRFNIEIPDDTFITYFDMDKTEKIVSNILSNAFKFTPSWGLVSCSIKIIKPEESNCSPILVVNVKDNGVGISPDDVEKIFDRFYRVEGLWEKDGSGTGIGLSLTHEFVSLLHGEIKVNSEAGIGSTFEITIPLGKEHLKPNEYVIVDLNDKDLYDSNSLFDQHCILSEKEVGQPEKALSVLIIEDNKDLRLYLSENLAGKYHVFEAENGRDGLAIALSKIPDLIITDLILPEINGLEVALNIKNDERTSHIPVIILTAKTTVQDKIEGLKSGADDYIVKPFDIEELWVRINNLIVLREKLRVRYGKLTGLEHTNSQKAGVDDRFMAKVTSIISENLKDFDFDVGVLQEKVGMSRVHLYRKIKAITGLSPSILIRNMRLKQAAHLISVHSGNLTTISMSVGFSNPSYFSKCFRELYGISPKDYTPT